jgi:hypothetical protein
MISERLQEQLQHVQLLLVQALELEELLQHNLSAHQLCHFSPKQHACAHKLLVQ